SQDAILNNLLMLMALVTKSYGLPSLYHRPRTVLTGVRDRPWSVRDRPWTDSNTSLDGCQGSSRAGGPFRVLVRKGAVTDRPRTVRDRRHLIIITPGITPSAPLRGPRSNTWGKGYNMRNNEVRGILE